MKVTKKQVRIIGYVGLSAASYAVIMVILTNVFGIEHYTVAVDHRIVPDLNAQLTTLIETLPCGLSVAPDISAKKIQDQFPWINSLSFYRIPTKKMVVNVAIEEPQVKINSTIITERLRVLPAATFIPASIAALPTLAVTFPNNPLNQIPQQFVPHAKMFASEQFAPYALTWIDEYHARLIDKEQPLFTILFNAYAIPDAAMFAHCASIKKQLEARGSFAGRQKGTHWVADVRFERQVIVFSEKGGLTHG